MAKPKYEKWLEKENLILLEGWRRDGLTLDQIAKNMGINVSTLHLYMNAHKEILNALKKGEEVAIYEVENAMYKSALGHYAEEVERIETKDANNDVVQTIVKGHRRYIPPNVGAQIFILKNRRNIKWRDNPEFIENEKVTDDGFLKALEGSAAEDWKADDGEVQNE